MAVTLTAAVCTGQFTTSTSARTGTFSAALTAGNRVVVAVASLQGSNPGVTVTDSAGNVYAQDKTSFFSSARVEIFSAPVVTGGAGVVLTVTPSATAYITFSAFEVTGQNTSTPVGASSTNFNTALGTAADPGAVASSAGDLIVGAITNSSSTSYTQAAGFTLQNSQPTTANQPLAVQYLSSDGSSHDATWTYAPSTNWFACSVIYKVAPAGGGGAPAGRAVQVNCAAARASTY